MNEVIEHHIKSATVGRHAFVLQGLAGSLEGIVDIPPQADLNRFAVICHPLSTAGGSMNNKVVTTVARACKELNIPCIRFNFRSVGHSEGEFDDGMGEQDDLLIVWQWMMQILPDARGILAGFSFGSFVSFQMSNQLKPSVLISIAPPVHYFDYTQAEIPQSPWIVIQAEADELVPHEAMDAWLDSLNIKPVVLRFAGASHFFHGCLVEFRQRLITALRDLLGD